MLQKKLFQIHLLVILVTSYFSLTHTADLIAAAELKEDTKIWGNITATGDATSINSDYKRSLWWIETQYRLQKCCSPDIGPQQSLIRPGLGYALTVKSSIWVGYAHFVNYLDSPRRNTYENRLWEQYMWSGPTLLGLHVFRSRLEQRWFSNKNDKQLRFRQLLKYSWAIPRTQSIKFVAWDEFFIELLNTDWNSNNISYLNFEQNRAFIGVGYLFTKKVWVETGYLNQFVKKQSGKNTELNHVFSISLLMNTSTK